MNLTYAEIKKLKGKTLIDTRNNENHKVTSVTTNYIRLGKGIKILTSVFESHSQQFYELFDTDMDFILTCQINHGYDELQKFIDNGMAWTLEGSYGRAAMAALESGACVLPLKAYNDAYGNHVPSRDMLQAGTKGTLENSLRFWRAVEDGDIELDN